jgi:hypothetical protein
VLDLQALFQLTGHNDLAGGLSPDNWHHQYAIWRGRQPAELPEVTRPDTPLPE